jgi:hypothetical protein
MKNTLVVVADLACLKAYKLQESQVARTPRLELVDHYENADAHGKLVDKVTDLSGRFSRGGTAGAMADGERHNIELEMRKRLVRQLAQRVNNLARDNGIERCLVAFSREINAQLIEELDPRVRAKIERNLAADLTKLDKTELLRHFQAVVA